MKVPSRERLGNTSISPEYRGGEPLLCAEPKVITMILSEHAECPSALTARLRFRAEA